MDRQALLVTLQLAFATVAILALLGLPLAWWLATTQCRARLAVETIVAMPLVLPPTVLGFFILEATSPGSVIGNAWESATGTRLPFTFAGILLGSVLFNLPFAVRPFAAAFAAVDRRLLEAARCLGAGSPATFLRIGLPLALPGVLAGLVLTFAHAVGEFGVVLMVGGNIPGVTRTLSIAIYDDVEALHYRAAMETSLVLVVAAFVVLGLAQVLARGRRLP